MKRAAPTLEQAPSPGNDALGYLDGDALRGGGFGLEAQPVSAG